MPQQNPSTSAAGVPTVSLPECSNDVRQQEDDLLSDSLDEYAIQLSQQVEKNTRLNSCRNGFLLLLLFGLNYLNFFCRYAWEVQGIHQGQWRRV